MLIRAVLQGENYRLGRIDMPDPSSDGLHSFDDLRRCSCNDCSRQKHSWFEIMDAEFLTVDGCAGTLRHVREMPQRAVLHLDDKIVSLNRHHSCTLDGGCRRCISRRSALLGLYLRSRAYRKGQSECPYGCQRLAFPVLRHMHSMSSIVMCLTCGTHLEAVSLEAVRSFTSTCAAWTI